MIVIGKTDVSEVFDMLSIQLLFTVTEFTYMPW